MTEREDHLISEHPIGTAGNVRKSGYRTLGRRALFLDLALMQEQDLRGHIPGETHLMGHDDMARPSAARSRITRKHFAHQFRVQGPGRLVEQHDLRLHHQRPE